MKSFEKFIQFTLNTVLSWLMKVILLGCVIYTVLDQNYLLGAASLLALTLSLTPQFLHQGYQVTLPWEIDLLAAFSLVLHIFFGEVLDFYDHVYLFDKIMHFFGTAVVCVLGFMWVYAIHYLTPVHLTH